MASITRKEVRPELLGVLLVAGSLLLGTSLASYYPLDPSPFTVSTGGQVKNLMGRAGAYLADSFFMLFGAGAYLVPLVLLYQGVRRFSLRRWSAASRLQLAAGGLLLMCSLSLLSQLYLERLPVFFGTSELAQDSGGLAGRLLSDEMLKFFAPLGTHLIAWTALLAAILMTTSFSLRQLFSEMALGLEALGGGIRGGLRAAEQWMDVLKGRSEKQRPGPRPVLQKQGPPKILEAPVPASPPQPRQETLKLPPSGEAYVVPPLSLLDDPPHPAKKLSKEDLLMNSRLLERRFQDFGVDGHVTAVHPGPVVTLFEYQPGPGVKLQKITNLSDDLALAMKVMSVRIVAPLPGKSTVGIEVPNAVREDVSLKEILASDAFQDAVSAPAPGKNGWRPIKLALALGKDIFGSPVVVDLASMPHLLVAGATGSGKSVALNTLIISLICNATPREARFLLIDPKRLELAGFDEIPHLVSPVVYKPKDASRALNRMVEEMQRRYRLLAEHGVRSIESYNQKAAGDSPLPYIIVVVDELADLMLVAAREVEDALMRLAQMARAAGIHLILATQRPSVDVLTGVIKANFSARISFQVSSKTDSRTILDANGAEQLLGRGDMLFMGPAGSKLTRVHGPYVSETEIQKVVEFIKNQGRPEYLIPLSPEEAGAETGAGFDERDDLYEQAVQLVITTGQASASFIQRRMRVGYPRAARMIEMMEEDGIIGPAVGSKAREVYAKQAVSRKPYDPSVTQ